MDIQDKEEEVAMAGAPAAPAPAGGGPLALPRPVGQGDAAGGGRAQRKEEGSSAQRGPQHLRRSGADGCAVPTGVLMLKALAIRPTSHNNGSNDIANARRCGTIEFLGEGTFGRVFQLKHHGKEDVAIKFPKYRNDISTEVAALASVPPTRTSCSSLTCTAWGTRWG